jgi:hemoglobin-like flavoprotein
MALKNERPVDWITAPEARLVKDAVLEMISSGGGPAFATHFYDRLFFYAPQTREWFPVDLAELHRKLISSLRILIGNLPDWDLMRETVEYLTRVHARLNLKPVHFDLFYQCMLEAMETVRGAPIDDKTRVPLRRAIERIGQAMMAAA